MKHSVLLIVLGIAAAPAFALPASFIAAALPEASTISLIAAGIVALGITRRKVAPKH